VDHRDADILGGPLDDSGAEGRRWTGRPGFIAALVFVGLSGVLVGIVAARAWTAHQPAPRSAPVVNVQVSLAADVGGLLTTQNGMAVVEVSTVMLNTGSEPLSLVAIKATGPGAAVVADPALAQLTPLPVRLPPGQFAYVHFAITSNCSVAVRPVPRVTLVVRDVRGHTLQLDTRIPDLDSVWGQSLDAQACRVP
jgi:hypothetical protein